MSSTLRISEVSFLNLCISRQNLSIVCKRYSNCLVSYSKSFKAFATIDLLQDFLEGEIPLFQNFSSDLSPKAPLLIYFLAAIYAFGL